MKMTESEKEVRKKPRKWRKAKNLSININIVNNVNIEKVRKKPRKWRKAKNLSINVNNVNNVNNVDIEKVEK